MRCFKKIIVFPRLSAVLSDGAQYLQMKLVSTGNGKETYFTIGVIYLYDIWVVAWTPHFPMPQLCPVLAPPYSQSRLWPCSAFQWSIKTPRCSLMTSIVPGRKNKLIPPCDSHSVSSSFLCKLVRTVPAPTENQSLTLPAFCSSGPLSRTADHPLQWWSHSMHCSLLSRRSVHSLPHGLNSFGMQIPFLLSHPLLWASDPSLRTADHALQQWFHPIHHSLSSCESFCPLSYGLNFFGM